MFPTSMLKFTDKFEFDGGLTVRGGTTIISSGLEVVRLPLNTQGIRPPGAIISDLVVNNSFTLNNNIAADLGKGFYDINKDHVISAIWWKDESRLQFVVDDLGQGWLSCDYRIKENIQSPSNVLDRLCSLNMFNYEYKNISIFKKNGTHLGVYAHELQDAFPELHHIVQGKKNELTTDGNIQPQSINPEFTNLLLKGLQELNLKVVELENKIIELENKS